MKPRAVLSVALLIAALGLPGVARADVVCTASLAGGEWPSYGGTLDNARTQLESTKLSAASVANLAPAFVFDSTVAAADSGGFTNIPVVAGGCVFAASRNGYVFALDAVSGALQWRSAKFTGGSGLGGLLVGTPAVADGRVFISINHSGQPRVAALDATGEHSGTPGQVLWDVRVDQGWPGQYLNGSPVVIGDRIFMGIAAGEGRADARGAYAILDVTTGDLVHHAYTISDAEYAAGYRGASIWCTPAVNMATGYVYACGGNPASKKLESRYSNALLKIDVREGRDTFGQIVAAYKGDVDQYYPGLDRQPVCDAFGDDLLYASWSAACLQLDLDFGASPTLFTDSLGNQIVGDVQKSGVFHAAYADNMQRAWTTIVGIPCVACNLSSPAHTGSSVFVVGSGAGQLISMTKNSGRYEWTHPMGDGLHWNQIAATAGVIFATDAAGTLYAFDSASGRPLAHRSVTSDAGAIAADAASAGLSIAYDTVYVNAGDFIVFYR